MKVNKLIMQLLKMDGNMEIVLTDQSGNGFYELDSLETSDCRNYLILYPNYTEIATGEYLEAENGFSSALINMEV